jgi:hypothetical protein
MHDRLFTLMLAGAAWFALAILGQAQCFLPFVQVDKLGTGAGLVVADFNHDGIDDFASATPNREAPPYDGTLNVFLSRGDGTFFPTITHSATFGAYALAAADLDADGNSDIIVANSFGTAEGLDVFLGNGDGNFHLKSRGIMDPNGLSALVVGDFTGDGKFDAVISTFFAKYIAVVVGNGDGTMTGPTKIQQANPHPWNMVSGDFNGDGRLDVATINDTLARIKDGLYVYLGNGDGTFGHGHSFSTRGDDAFGGVVGDFNEDGKLDIAVANGDSNSVGILLGNGDGTFQEAVTYHVTKPFDLAMADFNADGHPDLVTVFPGQAVPVEVDPALSVLMGKGDGTFRMAMITTNLPLNTWRVATADFNRDGFADLAFSASTGEMAVAMNAQQCP